MSANLRRKVLEFDQDMGSRAITTLQLNSVASDLNRFMEVELDSKAKGILRKGHIARSKCLALMQETGMNGKMQLFRGKLRIIMHAI